MKKVFLVDDEIVIRENMRASINWEDEGFVFCGDAPDGEVALPLIEDLKPDILITDIKMPFMNGLELSAVVRKILPATKIVILSGHDDFDYARQAIRLGVEDYCLKPFGSAEILRMLRLISAKIDKEKALDERTERFLRKHADASREELLRGLCNGLIASAEADERSAELDLPLAAGYYAVVLTDIRVADDAPPDQKTAHVEQLVGKLLADHIPYMSYKSSRNEKVWLLKGDEESKLRTVLDDLTGPLKKRLEESYGCNLIIGIGSIVDDRQNIHLSYLEADEDKHWRRLSSINKLALFELVGHSFDRSAFLDRKQFVEFLKVGDASQCDDFIRRFAADLGSIDWQSSLYGYYLLNDVTIEVIREAQGLFRNLTSRDESLASLQGLIVGIGSWEQACAYLRRLAEQFWQWRAQSSDKYGEMIAQIKAFVQANYANERLSLQDAADHVCVSPSHMSKIFSQETGQTFIEYLMRTRIEQAKILLKSSNAKSYEIAYQVGYQDPHYFSSLFKRVTGVTIREYRKQAAAMNA